MTERDVTRRRFLAACGAALGVGTAGCNDLSLESDDDGAGERVDPVTPDGSSAGDFDQFDQSAGDAYADVYGDAIDSVAQIQVYDGSSGPAGGTGFVYNDDYVVTNEHVVSEVEEASLRFAESGWLDGDVVGTDVYSDLAVISVPDRPESASPLPLRESDPAVGTKVVAIGNPFGFSGSVSAGIVSGVNRALRGPNQFSIPDAIQTDAAVNPGNSGGPLVTLDGNVAGVVNSGGGDNIGFAISSALTNLVIPELLADGEFGHSYMGVEIRDVGPLLARANDIERGRGVYVSATRSGTPAEGVFQGSTGETVIEGQSVETGGDVIVEMESTPIPTNHALASFLALETSPGDTIAVAVLRDGSRQTVDLTLGSRPDP